MKLNTLKVILGAAILCAFLSVSAQKNSSNFKPLQADKNVKPRNIVFILTDDHRADFMGFTGKVPWLETPAMDKLANEGAWFKNAFVTTSLCSPSRASILTGMYSHTHTFFPNQAQNGKPPWRERR